MCIDESPETDSLMEEMKINFNAAVPRMICAHRLREQFIVFSGMNVLCMSYISLYVCVSVFALPSLAVINFINISSRILESVIEFCAPS